MLTSSHRLKLNRAKRHFDLLNGEISAFLDLEPFGAVFGKPGPEAAVIPILGIVKVEPSLEWPVIVGDCVHNLRSGLDHLAWELAGVQGRAQPGTEFPVFLDRDKYWRMSGGRPARGSGLHKVRGMNQHIQEVIEGLQPYNRSDGPPDLHPLWLLQQLSNEDKHKALSVIGTVMEDSEVNILRREGSGCVELEHVFDYGVPLRNGAQIGYLRVVRSEAPISGPPLEMEFAVDGTFFVAFGKERAGRGLRVLDTLASVANYISLTVLPQLEPLLSPPRVG